MSATELYIEYSVTYNPRPLFSSVGFRTRRSPLTASERSTAIGITTGMIGTTGGKRRKGNVVVNISTFQYHPYPATSIFQWLV